ncbi:hypothetical protein JOB18_045804 [Solea senegalensis]|uniref:Uncharacterized protein n=1 Tax=Solea senegalensis TaxID=28829 RepID=A0AAV6Q800_SOLSE|nr:hypothetical protein JOB18_045804 [Solea senegalensis]
MCPGDKGLYASSALSDCFLTKWSLVDNEHLSDTHRDRALEPGTQTDFTYQSKDVGEATAAAAAAAAVVLLVVLVVVVVESGPSECVNSFQRSICFALLPLLFIIRADTGVEEGDLSHTL